MIDEMWKSETEGRMWLLAQLGYDVHFRDIQNMRELKYIHELLLARYKSKILANETNNRTQEEAEQGNGGQVERP